MNTDRQDPDAYPFALPTLSAEAAVEIQNFSEYGLDQFDVHYAGPVRRFYQNRAEPTMVRPTPPAAAAYDDDPPF